MDDAHGPRRLLVRGLVFLLVWGILNSVAWIWGDQLARHVIPLYKISFTGLTDHYRLQSLRIEHQSEPYFKIQVTTAGNRVLNHKNIPDKLGLSSQTLLGHTFQPIIIALSLLLSWPAQQIRCRFVAIIIAIPIMILALALDVPVVLLGSLEDLIYANFYPQALNSVFSIHVMNFMNGGGRLLLGIFGAAGSMFLARTLIFLSAKQAAEDFKRLTTS